MHTRQFYDLLRESTIISGFIVLSCVSVLCYLAVVGRPIPDVLVNISLTVVGYFFGTKATIRDNNLIRSARG